MSSWRPACLPALCPSTTSDWHVRALHAGQSTVTGTALQVWYSVPAHASEALEDAVRDALPHLFETAPDLLYQLVTMVSPKQLQVRQWCPLGLPCSVLRPCRHASPASQRV